MRGPIQKGYAETPFGQIHFRRVDGPGFPLVLLHRTPVDSSCFEQMLGIFAGQRAAIALDTPGFGQSFCPAFMPDAAEYGAWLLTAVDAMGIDHFHICAHHTGTHFGVELARLGRQRVQSLLLNGVLYATEIERAEMRHQIGQARKIDEAGDYQVAAWNMIKSLFPRFDAAICHNEFLGALASPAGRDQAFNAILMQDFAAAIAQVDCPIAIVQGCDDPLDKFRPRIRQALPNVPIDLIGPAGLAAPELQPEAYAAYAMAFAAQAEQAFHSNLATAANSPITG